MLNIPKDKVLEGFHRFNPWWNSPKSGIGTYGDHRSRPYLRVLLPLVEQDEVRRAVVLMGPRRVGKTFLLHHVIGKLMKKKVDPRRICYVSVDHPLFNGLGLEEFVELFREAGALGGGEGPAYVFFDEIQYLKDWEVHLKTLVDMYPAIRFTVSGSAAAALKLKSAESGAGRFTDFILPPLTFYEYLELLDKEHLIGPPAQGRPLYRATDLGQLNEEFLRYINYGGYPEVIFSEEIQADPGRYIKSDIIDKVLLRDLPGLYGIQDIQELNYLFTTLAYNSAGEVSLEALASGSGVAKNTIKKYLEYLEAAFLIRVVHRVDKNARRFKRANFFKVYLTNPSIRTALFSPVGDGDDALGNLVETAVFAQWFHHGDPMYYGRWARGEVDVVGLGPTQKPHWATEIKWSDRIADHPGELKQAITFARKNRLNELLVTTKTILRSERIDGVPVEFTPAAEYCLSLGKNIIDGK